jgi:hypothetical protein
MDAKPRSNKIKRLERKRKLQEKKRKLAQWNELRLLGHGQAYAPPKVLAELALRASNALRRQPGRLLRWMVEGEVEGVPISSDLGRLFADIDTGKVRCEWHLRPDMEALGRLVLVGHQRTSLFRGGDRYQYASALLALAAHRSSWVRQPEDWRPRGLEARWQLHALIRHLLARYDVPIFMNSAWHEELTEPGVVHQRWFIHVAQGQNLRTAEGLPIPLTRKQAHLYLQAPGDFGMLGAFRWAQIIDLGGDEAMVRRVLTTRLRTEFAHDEFWVSVFRWFIAHPLLDPAHLGPIIDYVYNQRFVATVPNPLARVRGQPGLVPAQPDLTLKGRDPVALVRAVGEWHRHLARHRTERPTSWHPSGIEPLRLEEVEGETRRTYTITELLSSRELDEEGCAMGHCVGSYAGSCASGRSSIWSLKLLGPAAQAARLLTVEVSNQARQIVQARQRLNALPEPKEMAILARWAAEAGLTLPKGLAR